MIIQNFDHSYQVMCHLDGTEKTEEFLCTELNAKDKEACLLIRITDFVLAKNFTLFLEEKIKDREFTDYLECFQAEGAFYAVFRYSLNQKLTERLLTEHCSLRERAEIARGLLEKLLLLNPHPYFAWNALLPQQITVNRNLEVHLNYHLEQVGRFDAYTMKEVGMRLKKVLQLLFAEEEKKKLYPLLEEYLYHLEQGSEWTYLELYQSFMPVYEELLEEKKEEQLPRTFWFKLWNRTKKVLAFLKKVLAVVILVATVLYVVNRLQDDSGQNVTKQTMSQIGELTIENTEMP